MSSKSRWDTIASTLTNTEGARAKHQDANAKSAVVLKSVSIFMATARRASGKNGDKPSDAVSSVQTASAKKKVHRKLSKLDEANGKLHPKVMESYKKKTHFSKIEIEALVRIYRKLVSNCHVTSRAIAANSAGAVIVKPHAMIEGIDRSVFRELLHSTFDVVTEEALMERIFCAWEKGHEGLPLRLEGWLVGISVLLRGTHAEKTAFCFRVYDLNGDGFITRDEMFVLLRNCLIKQPQDEDPDEGVRDLVEIALKKLDIDKDGKVSFQDYTTAVTEQPLLLEAFGQILPSEGATVSFLSTLQS